MDIYIQVGLEDEGKEGGLLGKNRGEEKRRGGLEGGNPFWDSGKTVLHSNCRTFSPLFIVFSPLLSVLTEKRLWTEEKYKISIHRFSLIEL